MKASFLVPVVLATLALADCTAPSQGALNAATAACSQGDRNACAQLPALNAQVQTENQNNQVATGVAAAAGGLLGGAAIGAAASPHYYYGYPYYHRCYGCW